MTIAPTEWNDTTVGAEFEVQLGKMLDAAKNVGSPKPYLGNRAVQWGRIDLTAAGVVPLTRRDMERFRLRKDDLLVCEGGEVGRAAIWEYDIECYYQKALHRLRTRRGYSPHILLALLELRARSDGFSDYVTQTSIAHLPRDKFIELPIPAIPSPEQERIASALLDADGLIAAIERAIAKKRDIKQGVIQQLLTGRTRLPGFTGEWEARLLRANGSTYGGLTGKNKPDFGVGQARFVTFLDVIYNTRIAVPNLERVVVHSTERQNRVIRGDVLFNGSSETPEEVALSAVVDFDTGPTTYLNSFCFGYRLSEGAPIDPTYLAYFFRASPGRALVASLAQGATRYNIAKRKFIELAPLLPPLDEQAAIVSVLHDVDDEITTLATRLDKARAVKTGVMQQLLTGRTRLPVEAAL